MRLIAGHSFNRGTGQSTILANLAACLTIQGQKVCLIDACFSSPSLHFFYGLDPGSDIKFTLNDYLRGNCDVEDAVTDLTRRLRVGTRVKGQLSFASMSPDHREIMRFLRGGFFVDLLVDGIQEFAEKLEPDIMLIDSSSGIDEPATKLISMSDLLLTFLRPDQRDFFGTGILLDVAQKLEVPEIQLIINQVPPDFDSRQVTAEVSRAYDQSVILSLPYSQSIATVASAGLIVLRQPDDPVTLQFNQLSNHITKHWEPLR